jgi:Flp pilus assembly protein TadD
LLDRKQYAEAIEQLRQTLTPEDESTPGFLYGLGAAYGRAGERQHALEYIRQARRRAMWYRQQTLLDSIDRDLRTLEQHP